MTDIFNFFLYISSLLRKGSKEKEDQELMPSLDPQLRDDFSRSPAVSVSVTGWQMLDEIEKMSSVERPITSQQWGLA